MASHLRFDADDDDEEFEQGVHEDEEEEDDSEDEEVCGFLVMKSLFVFMQALICSSPSYSVVLFKNQSSFAILMHALSRTQGINKDSFILIPSYSTTVDLFKLSTE